MLKRIITAIIWLPIIYITIMQKHKLPFTLLLTMLTFFGLLEYFRILFNKFFPNTKSNLEISILTILGSLVFAYFSIEHPWKYTSFLNFLNFYEMIILFLLAYASIILFTNNNISEMLYRCLIVLVGWLYIPGLLQYVVKIHQLPDGAFLTLFLISIIFLYDTGAYFTGVKLGKRKLIVNVSPNKTIEGTVGGFLSSLLGGGVLGYYLLPHYSMGGLLVIIFLTAFFAQIGDLIESMFKRFAGVKDTGKMFYGHGGALDRLDSVLAGSFIFYLNYHIFL